MEAAIGLRDRYRGSLLGLAAGDALGTTVEFTAPGTFEPIDDIVGGGPFGLEPGEWTDDTRWPSAWPRASSSAAASTRATRSTRYVRWWRDGHLSSDGRCFDIGIATSAALRRFERTGEPYAGLDRPGRGRQRLAHATRAGAAVLRRPIRPGRDRAAPPTARARLTPRPTAVDACRYLAGLIVGRSPGVRRTSCSRRASRRSRASGTASRSRPEIDEVAAGSFKHREPPEIKGSGYVVRSLEAALWAFDRSDDFRDGALLAVNLGDDADTTGAVYGQLAGAYYGEAGIPAEWRSRLALLGDDRGARRSAARGGRLIEQPALAGYPSDPYRLRPRLTTRLTLPPPGSTVPGLGFCEITRPLLTLRVGAADLPDAAVGARDRPLRGRQRLSRDVLHRAETGLVEEHGDGPASFVRRRQVQLAVTVQVADRDRVGRRRPVR